MDGTLARAEGTVVRALDDELLVLLPDRQGALHLDRTASVVWELLAVPRTPAALAAAVAEAFDADPVQVAVDLAPVLAVLREQGAVRPAA